MKIGALSILARTSSRYSFNLASWHSAHSLTWSWIVSISLDGEWRGSNGGLRFGVFPWRDNGGSQAVVALPFIVIQRHRQREMWFRDMYFRSRDREDDLERKVSALRRQLTMARATALVSSESRH